MDNRSNGSGSSGSGGGSSSGAHGNGTCVALEKVPLRFVREDQYIDAFHPLLVEEVKAALEGEINGTRASTAYSSSGE